MKGFFAPGTGIMGVVCLAEVSEQVHSLCVGSVILNVVMNLCGVDTVQCGCNKYA